MKLIEKQKHKHLINQFVIKSLLPFPTNVDKMPLKIVCVWIKIPVKCSNNTEMYFDSVHTNTITFYTQLYIEKYFKWLQTIVKQPHLFRQR